LDFCSVVDNSAVDDREIRRGPSAIYSAAEIGRKVFADKAVADCAGGGPEGDSAAGRARVADYRTVADSRVGCAGAEDSAAVVGVVVSEISIGLRFGIGRLILSYSQEATGDPAKVYTAVVGAAALGLAMAALVSLVDRTLSKNRPAEAQA